MSPSKLTRNLAWFLGATMLVLSFTSTDALAKKDKKGESEAAAASAGEIQILPIEETGISSFDEVYMKARDLNDKLAEANNNINGANDAIVTGIGVTKGTPIADAIADLKAKAPGMFTIEMDGLKPKVDVKPEAPDNVKTAVDAINTASEDLVKAVELLKAVPGDAQELVAKAKEFPATAPQACKDAGLAATEIPGVVKKVKNNTKSTLLIPDNAKTLTGNATDTLKTIGTLGQP